MNVQGRRKLPVLLLCLRFLLAFLVGWFFALLAAKTPLGAAIGDVPGFAQGISFVLLALLFGVAVTWTVGNPIALSAGTGLCAVIGAYIYLLPLSLSADAQEAVYCTHNECHLPAGLGTTFLTILLVLTMVLIFLGAGATGLLRKKIRRAR